MTQPGKPLGMSDFFGLEAGEYLERLDAILGKPEPGAEEFARLTRALRGSALMANQAAIARAAAGLEALARAVREGRRAWDVATKQLAVRAVDDLKVLVRRAATWTDADTAKAAALGAELEQLAGPPSGGVRSGDALGLDAGARAFVAREGAAIASALDRAAQALRTNPLAHDPLQHVLRALQPLRGLAALNDLPPLPGLLEGIERAVGELERPGSNPPASVGELFQAAAAAIARAAREVAEQGRPNPEGPEFQKFAGLAVQFMESEPDIVGVAALYYNDGGPQVVQRGVAAARPAALGRLELVSHGEHLRQAADSLERAPSPTQRELRAHTLAGTFRALANAGGGALAERVAQFAAAAREAVSSGVAVRRATEFANVLRRAGDLLTRSGAGDEAALAAELDDLTGALHALGGPGARPAPSAPLPPPAPSAVADQSVPESPDLVGSWAVYQRLTRAGVGPASLEELVALKDARTAPRAPSLDTGRPVEPSIVDIRALLYRGDRALQRAHELREQAKHATGDALRALVDEVCDLVALAAEPGPPGPPGPLGP